MSRYNRGIIKGYTRRGGYYGRFGSRFGYKLGIRPEKKFFDTNPSEVQLAATGTVVSLSLNRITQGSGESQLVGRRCTVKRININFSVEKQGSIEATIAALLPSDSFRLFLIQDTQVNGGNITWDEVFENQNIRSMHDLEHSQRFRVLKEWNGDMQADVSTTEASGTTTAFNSSYVTKQKKWSKSCNIRLDFSAETTPGTRAQSEIRSNNLAMLGISRFGTVAVVISSRIRFSDE